MITSGGDDVYVAKFDSNGGHVWSNGWGDVKDDKLMEFSTYGDGKVLVVASFGNDIDPVGTPPFCSGYTYAAGLDANGDYLWSKKMCSGPSLDLRAADVNIDGEFAIAGKLQLITIDLGGGPLVGGEHYQYAGNFQMDEATGLEESIPSYGMEITSYPNPFNPSTTIRFTLPQRTNAELAVFNALGELVAVLAHGNLQEGPHSITWDGRDGSGNTVGSGLYFCRLETPGSGTTRKLVLTK